MNPLLIALAGRGKPPVSKGALSFSDPDNSQYVPLLFRTFGAVATPPSLDFSDPENSQYVPALMRRF